MIPLRLPLFWSGLVASSSRPMSAPAGLVAPA
eukprot:CAMPEP_0171165446 /NCGR_PEP_ID=MMETSP0790-20130122/6190_1 /TAXON_ID=2925 /ORGANISM="Alexandrium catenella, Strain OF101" /LENGTH=31 /DNA_ID= /DNA_START= /DNA_END= /DNA_ORIENTATION=